MFFQFTLKGIYIGAFLHFQVNGTDFGGVLKQLSGKFQRSKDIGTIIFLLIHSKHQSGREQVSSCKGSCRIGHVHLSPSLGSIHFQRVKKTNAGTQGSQ